MAQAGPRVEEAIDTSRQDSRDRPDEALRVACANNYVFLFQNIEFNNNDGRFVGAWTNFYNCLAAAGEM
ncbi:MAG TPA: hypothetical protein VIJ82_10130 [Streptosporangiaceae bacterium]|jgi:hypothetical protein